jgi:hypothetical protein
VLLGLDCFRKRIEPGFSKTAIAGHPFIEFMEPFGEME